MASESEYTNKKVKSRLAQANSEIGYSLAVNLHSSVSMEPHLHIIREVWVPHDPMLLTKQIILDRISHGS